VTPSTLFAWTVSGAIGLGLFLYGKKQRRVPHLAAGVLLMVFPYFVSSLGATLGITAAVLGLLYFATYLGL
jgi:hypothetical protein